MDIVEMKTMDQTFMQWYVYSAMGFYPVCPGSNRVCC